MGFCGLGHGLMGAGGRGGEGIRLAQRRRQDVPGRTGAKPLWALALHSEALFPSNRAKPLPKMEWPADRAHTARMPTALVSCPSPARRPLCATRPDDFFRGCVSPSVRQTAV